ncbi:DUF6301 family protein [Rugosimonospora africana]|uniref:Uncharacterized protein n=1 Tax=Rugosimonospora africana TaxID=556532 RepID=A0A8J3QPK1_9ACTN|nr:DUF6301 family protein [Rugosimonospora africana]GIH14074.1 hypothetical protein Raf01_22460 [Rugosimonospora africana]
MTEGQPVQREAAREWRMLSADEVRSLAQRLIDVEPMLRRAEPAQILARLGWRAAEEPSGIRNLLLADSGFGLTDSPGMLWLDDHDSSQVASVSTAVCDTIKPFVPAVEPFLQDTFALATRALTESFGQPTEVEGGLDATAAWRMDVLTLTLEKEPTTVTLVLDRNSDLDFADETSAYGS